MASKAKTNLTKLIATKRAQLQKKDARDFVAMAIASVNPKVTVNSTGATLRVSPANLLEGKLGGPAAGLKQKSAIDTFKANLGSLLPEHVVAIHQIPSDPSLKVNDVARYVSTLIRERAPAPAVTTPSWSAFQIPTVVVRSASAEARTHISNLFGKALAEKASDRLVQALRVASGFGREQWVGPRPMIVELKALPVAAAPAADREEMAPGRQNLINSTRDRFYQTMSSMCAEIDKRARAAVPGRESLAAQASPTDVCWLNATLRSRIEPKSLAEVAADSKIVRVGLPRRLQRDLNVTGVTVGAIAFRTAQKIDGTDILVAVIDGEVAVDHPFLKNRVQQMANFTGEAWGTPDSHGTAVAGIIASADPAFGGMAPGVKIANYKIFATNPNLTGTDFEGALAIQRALEEGARIANCSWGAGPAGDGTSREARACDNAWALGLIIVKSAGNNGPGPGTMTSPADATGVIVVGATDRKGTAVQNYSSRGPAGKKAGPDIVAPGGTDADGIRSLLTAGGGSGPVGYGTSFAAPHISGLAALLLAQKHAATPDQIRDTLKKASTALPGSTPTAQGSGLVKL